MNFPLRYVVLHHTGIENPHFDLMLELTQGSELATWRLPHWPPKPADEFTPLEMHRREYLDYQGPVSGNRGQVQRIASGHCRILKDSPTELHISLNTGGNLSLPRQ